MGSWNETTGIDRVSPLWRRTPVLLIGGVLAIVYYLMTRTELWAAIVRPAASWIVTVIVNTPVAEKR